MTPAEQALLEAAAKLDIPEAAAVRMERLTPAFMDRAVRAYVEYSMAHRRWDVVIDELRAMGCDGRYGLGIPLKEIMDKAEAILQIGTESQ